MVRQKVKGLMKHCNPYISRSCRVLDQYWILILRAILIKKVIFKKLILHYIDHRINMHHQFIRNRVEISEPLIKSVLALIGMKLLKFKILLQINCLCSMIICLKSIQYKRKILSINKINHQEVQDYQS